jgi:aspartate aminotransferase
MKGLTGNDAECECQMMQNRVATLQALSGTGSLKVGAVFIEKFLPGTQVYLSNPTWGNHRWVSGNSCMF